MMVESAAGLPARKSNARGSRGSDLASIESRLSDLLSSEDIQYPLSQFVLMGTLRVVALIQILEARWTQSKAALARMSDAADGFAILCDSLGIPARRDMIAPDLAAAFTSHVETIKKNVVKSSFWSGQVLEHYGRDCAIAYGVGELLVAASYLASAVHVAQGLDAQKGQESFSRREARQSRELVSGMLQTFRRAEPWLRRELGSGGADWMFEAIEKFEGSDDDRTRFQSLHVNVAAVMHAIVPAHGGIIQRAERARELVKELSRCRRGRAGWQAYERISLKIARFLFVPPQRRILCQARRSDGRARRDIVIVNTASGGFWNHIRDEFSSKNIIIECKNNSGPVTARDLNQVRAYAQRRSIGKFAMIFCRESGGESAASCVRDLYQDSGIMTLIVGDEELKKMICARVYLGSADVVLEDLKSDFEIAF